MSEKPSLQRSDAAPSSASAAAAQSAAPAPAPAGASQSSPQTSPSPASLKVANPERLSERIQNVYDNIARRAFEMFERDGWSHGRDLDHWFQAEEELLHPVHIHIKDSDQALSLRAEVPGFTAGELQYRLEPRSRTIAGRKETVAENKTGRTLYKERCSEEVLRVVELPAEIDTSKTTMTLRDGILEFNMPKTVVNAARPEQSKSTAAGR
jgi:HSP20 family molecular chaperone IbpA